LQKSRSGIAPRGFINGCRFPVHRYPLIDRQRKGFVLGERKAVAHGTGWSREDFCWRAKMSPIGTKRTPRDAIWGKADMAVTSGDFRV